jgi:hypothetical protein
VTTIEHPEAAYKPGISKPAMHTGQDELTDTLPVSPAKLAQVLAHLRGRARSHPDSPATGLNPLSDDQWRTCITELRRHGYRITESVATRGERAANKIGYTLIGEPPPTDATPAHCPSSTRSNKSITWSADRSPALAP